MESKLRLLIIDDNPDDRSLVLRELRRAFGPLNVTEAGNLPALEQAMNAPGFDLVVTDYRMGWSNGLDVIREVKRRWMDAVVIMFTGTGNEEVAVEAMQSGADDYVLKNPKNFARIGSSARVALKIKKQSRELHEAQQRFQTLFETVPIGLFRCTPSGKILDANPAFATLLEFSDIAEVRRVNFSELHSKPGQFENWRDELEREGSIASIETELKASGGRTRWVHINARAMRDNRTGQSYYEGSLEDITPKKVADTERERLIAELRNALGKVRTLTGLLPICSSCKKIRDERGAWNLLESYIETHSCAQFTHGFCPDCVRKLYPEVFLDTPKY